MRDLFEIKGSEWQDFPAKRRVKLLDRAFRYWRDKGFPYYSLNVGEIRREFSSLAAQKVTAASEAGGVAGSSVGLRLANNFHPQMWSVRVSRYLSPMDVFLDDEKLVRAIEKAWLIWPDRYGARPSCLRRILKSFPNAASVSNFRPTVSRSIVASYTRPGEAVVDFSSGYGGRMLGCLAVGRNYIGIEPCAAQVRGSRKMLATLHSLKLTTCQATLYRGCAEDTLPSIPSRSAALIFSSPPYYDWERYSTQSTQSFRRHGSYAAWLSGFMAPVIAESRRILKRGAHLILNISGKRRYPSREDVEALASHSGFVLRSEFPLQLARIPYLHPRSSGAHKLELLLVFQKS